MSSQKKYLTATGKRQVAADLVAEHQLSVSWSCQIVGVSRSSWYRPRADPLARDVEIVDAMNVYFDLHPRRGFGKCFKGLRAQGGLGTTSACGPCTAH
jgi:hypothetical protein